MQTGGLRILIVGAMLALWPAAAPCMQEAASLPGKSAVTPERELALRILANRDLAVVLEQARDVLRADLNAGDGYGQVWIRDLNSFMELALEAGDRGRIRRALLTFFHFQQPNGEIIDGYIPAEAAGNTYEYTRAAALPGLRGLKNTVESDQESSLVQAVGKYVRATGDNSILEEVVGGMPVRQRLVLALDFLLAHRYSSKYGLVWGATTVDWGDVQPEHVWGVLLDRDSHRAIDVYDNAMLVIALDACMALNAGNRPLVARLKRTQSRIKAAVREHLWDAARHKFRPHVYLEGSPFPDDFDEDRIHVHGGTAVAIEAGLLRREEVRRVLADMVRNKRSAGAASIGLTVYPPYPSGYFRNPDMQPYNYQNGGDWTWFGARMIQQLVAHGLVAEAYREILPMVERARKNKGFFEWYTVDNQPRGSGTFRGEAGTLGKAIELLQAWAARNGGGAHAAPARTGEWTTHGGSGAVYKVTRMKPGGR